MVYIGIDPGFASGAFTIISNNEPGGKVIKCEDFEFYKNKGKKALNFGELHGALNPWRNRTVTVVLEQLAGRPNQSSSTGFKLGGGYYGIQAVLQIIRVPFIIVTPAKWKKFYNLGSEKDDSRALATQFYPCIDLEKKKDEHRAESLLLARYGMYLYGELKK